MHNYYGNSTTGYDDGCDADWLEAGAPDWEIGDRVTTAQGDGEIVAIIPAIDENDYDAHIYRVKLDTGVFFWSTSHDFRFIGHEDMELNEEALADLNDIPF